MSGERDHLSPVEMLSIQDRQYRTKFKADTEAHLVVDNEICRTCTHKACTLVCPVQNYTLNDQGQTVVAFEGCLECGACRIACTPRGLTWKHPRGGMGVCYRQG